MLSVLKNVSRLATQAPPQGSTVETLPIAVVGFDVSRRCNAANAAARALFAPLDVHDLSASAVFAHWSTTPDLRAGVPPGDGQVLTHGDGRLYCCHQSALPDGGICLTLSDISAHVQTAERSSRDHLTGLIQRAAFKEGLSVSLAVAAREKTSVAVHYVDLDRFKSVNDTLGHPVGDALLAKVAERLRSLLRPGDLVARFGGDEFAILQSGDVTLPSAQALAMRLIDLLARTYVVQGHMLHIGASVGIAVSPDDGTDPDTLLRHADLALYRSKAEGRGTARFFEPAMNVKMQMRRLLEADLRRALALRQFTLNFQPLHQLASGHTSGFEALLRWHHPDRGLVSPADFIPLSEEIGLIVPIGEWVLRTACHEAASWPVPATVAVNISPVQFKNGKLVQTVASVLAQSGLPPDRLELEITESALLDETNLVLSALHSIRALGVKIAMDDFGTGYSSLSYLRKFPFDKIKIDQSFVRGLGEDADCDAIVRAVARLGASLGMRTTAEGVETSAQMDRIRSEGCTEVQGYLTGRPMAATDVLHLLQQQHKDATDA